MAKKYVSKKTKQKKEIRAFLITMAALIILFSIGLYIAGRNAPEKSDSAGVITSSHMHAVVTDIGDDLITVRVSEPEEEQGISSGALLTVPASAAESLKDLEIGHAVTIWFDGVIEEGEPQHISNVLSMRDDGAYDGLILGIDE